ncbi:MAG: non-ribosomal peptide synthetase, partial [Gammaproteobacteria bacterium]
MSSAADDIGTGVAQALEEYGFPTSFAQQRLWFLDQLEGTGAAYHVRLPVRLSGELDIPVLEQALNRVVARHEALRTRIVCEDGEPRQRIASELRLPLRVHAAARNEDIASQAARLASEPFDLARGPLLRADLIRESPTRHLLLLVAHHAISDAWSSGVLFRDLAEFYSAAVESRPARLPDLPVQYADYAVWQREWLQGDELERQLGFWTQQLAGAPPLLPLPTERPRPRRQTFNGARWLLTLDAELSSALRDFARRERCTLFMLLLAAFKQLLARYSGQQDIVVGTPVAGRSRSELEHLVGLFANTLALRSRCEPGEPFREFLQRLRGDVLQAFAHQELPFEKLVEALQPPRDLACSPIFQVMFILQNTPWQADAMAGLEIAPGELGSLDAAKFDLTLSVSDFDGRLYCHFEYNRDLFDAATIERFADAWRALLQGLLAQPECSADALPLAVSARGRAACHGPELALPDVSLSDWLRQQCAAHAGGPVFEFGDASLTASEVVARAEQLAGALRAAGACSNVPVAVCLDRGLALPVALLGIAFSDAAWLPLDPEYPPARIDAMLSDSGAALLVTDSPQRFAGFDGTVLVIDAHGRLQSQRAGARTPGPIDSAQPLAYLIYTSGSTGQPKGVCIPQRALINFLLSMQREPGLARGERLLAVTTVAFDIAYLELLLPLCAGGTTVIAPASAVNDPLALAGLLDTAAIDVLQATPSTWRLLLAADWPGRAGLRMLSGGEPLDPALAAALQPRGAELWNLYGPTETTIWSSCGRVRDPAQGVGAGRAIANTRLVVCDAQGRPLPPGVPGELCIAGPALACGYVGDPQATAERFV